MMRALMGLCLAWAILPAAAGVPEPIGPELLSNGGFEQGTPAAGIPDGWSGFWTPDWGDCAGTVALSRVQPHEGAQCVEMSGVRDTYALIHDARALLDPGKTYLLTAWVKARLVRGQEAYLVASWFKEKAWLALERSATIAGRRDWTQLSLVLRPETRPESAQNAQLSFRVSGSSKQGRAWIDGVSLRECAPLQVSLGAFGERRRLLDMARELLVERAVWQDRLAVLKSRASDLETLAADSRGFEALRQRYEGQVRAGRFLTHRQRPREELAAGVPGDDAEVRQAVDGLTDLPQLRQECFAQLERIIDLKRQLDSRPELRRLYLWAQLAGMAGPLQVVAKAKAAPPRPSTEYLEAVRTPPAEPDGSLVDVVVRTTLGPGRQSAAVALTAGLVEPMPGTVLQAGVFDAAGRLVAFAAHPEGADRIGLQMALSRPLLWFPDCPYLYTVRIGLFREAEAVDWLEQKIAFRDIRILESDVTATMRHAHGWSAADYTFTINGQPYFPRGTVCGQARQYRDEAEGVFDELWLDYQRTYSQFLSRLSEAEADDMAARGMSLVGSMGANYRAIRSYASSSAGLQNYHEACWQARWLADHPALLAIEVGNEAELSVWGADLQSVYGADLWHVFNEAARVLREELRPTVPVAYVRAAHYGSVLPVPLEDYSGVNQYTGRYWGRRGTMTSDLDSLALAATFDNKPMGITEWNGPKYSWATRGVSGVDEQGAAEYIFDYYRTMVRTPMTVLSTEFVLNWVLTPLEDLTSVPLQEGLAERAGWRWFNQKGTPWYPAIWPDLETDTPGRRAMRGFQSPLFELCETPGPVAMAFTPGPWSRQADVLKGRLAALGKKVASRPAATVTLQQQDTDLLIIGGVGDGQPPAVRELEQAMVIGVTTADFPGPGRFLIQRRVNPHFPDRFLVVVTAGDEAGMAKALDKLLRSAQGLAEAYGRHANCGRLLALVDDDQTVAKAFADYVLELPTRGFAVSRDDLRTTLEGVRLLDDEGRLKGPWQSLTAVIVATGRRLTEAERDLLGALPGVGVNLVWATPALRANQTVCDTLGVGLGDAGTLAESIPVADWARGPLAVPQMGDVAVDRIERFSGLKPDSERLRDALRVQTLHDRDGWRAAARCDGEAVVLSRPYGNANIWVFGVDLQAAAVALTNTTRRGVNHRLYDRDTACGMERVFRLVANACVSGGPTERVSRPRLTATVGTAKQTYQWGDSIEVTVRVSDTEGNSPPGTAVRVSCARGDRFLGLPGEGALWVEAERVETGVYRASLPLSQEPAQGAPVVDVWPLRHRGERVVTVFAEASAPGHVGDWTCHTVRMTEHGEEPERMRTLARLVNERLIQTFLNVRDEKQWVEIEAVLTMPEQIKPGSNAAFEVEITRVEDDRGNDWMEQVELVLKRTDAPGEVVLPLAPGKLISSVNASVVKARPDDCITVDSLHPTMLRATWLGAKAGIWAASLRYLYSDDYHIKDTDRLLRDDAFPRASFEVR